MARHTVIFDSDWPAPPDPPRRRWWQILGDWLAKRFPWARGENQDPPVSS